MVWVRANEGSLGGARARGNSLALAVLQVEVRVEVDEDPLVGCRRRDHPHTLLRGVVGAGVAWRGQVVGAGDVDVPATFICSNRARDKHIHTRSTWELVRGEVQKQICPIL